MVGKSDGEMIKAESPAWAGWAPTIVFDEVAEHALDFWLTSEDLPLPNNRVTIGTDGEIHLALNETNQEAITG